VAVAKSALLHKLRVRWDFSLVGCCAVVDPGKRRIKKRLLREKEREGEAKDTKREREKVG